MCRAGIGKGSGAEQGSQEERQAESQKGCCGRRDCWSGVSKVLPCRFLLTFGHFCLAKRTAEVPRTLLAQRGGRTYPLRSQTFCSYHTRGHTLLCTCRAPPVSWCSAASPGAEHLLPTPCSLTEAAPRAAGGATQAAQRPEPPGYAAERPAGPANPATSNGADGGGGGGRGGGDSGSGGGGGGGGGGGEAPAAVKMLRALDKKLRQVRPSCAPHSLSCAGS